MKLWIWFILGCSQIHHASSVRKLSRFSNANQEAASRTSSLLGHARVEADREAQSLGMVLQNAIHRSAIAANLSVTHLVIGLLVLVLVFAIGVFSARFFLSDPKSDPPEREERASMDRFLAARGQRLAPAAAVPNPQVEENETRSPLPFQCQPTEHRGSVTIRKMRIPDVTMSPQESFGTQQSLMGAEWTIADDEESVSPSSPTKMQVVWSQGTNTSSRYGIEKVGSIVECDENSEDNASGTSSEPLNTLISSSPKTLGIQPSQAEKQKLGPGRALRKKPANPIPLSVQKEMAEETEEIPLSQTVSDGAQGSSRIDIDDGYSSRGSRHTWHQSSDSGA